MGVGTHSVIALFPGQGSQYVPMPKVLLDNFPWTREFYDEAADSIRFPLLKLCTEGPESELQLTQNAQPAILTTSYAWFQVARRELGLAPIAGGGHSLGEYSALLSAGALSLSEAVKLVRLRGELMQTAVPVGMGKMAALLGLSDEKTEALCRKATQGNSIVVPANFNSPGQVVIAGNTAAVERAEALATNDPELKARKVIPLKVSAPFHCPLMKPVAEKFYPSLRAIAWKPLAFPIAFNLDGNLRKEATIPDLLRDQIDHPVQWTKCAETLAKQGTVFVEMGPGKVLTGLTKRIAEGAQLFALDTIDDFRKFEKAYKEGFQ